MRVHSILFLSLVLIAAGCASIRDTRQGMESGTARTVDGTFDAAWAAVVEVMQPYPAAERDKATGRLVTDWVEELVEPATFSEQEFLKERTRWTVVVAAGEDGSRVKVLREASVLVPVYGDPVVQPGAAYYFAPWRGVAADAASPTTLNVLPNPWDKTRGAPVYVWRDIAQIEDTPAKPLRQGEGRILDAIEAALKRGMAAANAPN